MRVLLTPLPLFFALSLAASAACGDSHSGTCNICPNAQSVDTSKCAELGTAAGCASASIEEVTDDSCGVGSPPTTHQACVYDGCGEALDCEQIVTF